VITKVDAITSRFNFRSLVFIELAHRLILSLPPRTGGCFLSPWWGISGFNDQSFPQILLAKSTGHSPRPWSYRRHSPAEAEKSWFKKSDSTGRCPLPRLSYLLIVARRPLSLSRICGNLLLHPPCFPSFGRPVIMDLKKDGHEKVQTYAINDVTDNPMDDLDFTGVVVKPKWRGTAQDKLDMETLGRNQVLRVSRQSYCTRFPSQEHLLTGRVRETSSFCPCSGLEAHLFAHGRYY